MNLRTIAWPEPGAPTAKSLKGELLVPIANEIDEIGTNELDEKGTNEIDEMKAPMKYMSRGR